MSEIIELEEELARCKADKEFVWSLWKQLQQESPDITQAISDAVTREKNKQEIAQEKLTATLKDRDVEIDALKEELNGLNKTIAKLEISKDKVMADYNQMETKHVTESQRMLGQLNRATEEVGNLRSLVLDKEAEIDQHLKAIEVLMKRAGGLEKEMKSSKMEAMRLYNLNTNLQETIGQLQNNERLLTAKHSQEVEELCNRGDHCNRRDTNYTEPQLNNEEVKLLILKIDKLSKENDSLITKNTQLSESIEEKEKKVEEAKRLMQLMESTRPNGRGVSVHGRGTRAMSVHEGGVFVHDTQRELTDLKIILSRTKNELLETKGHLKSKEEEINCIKEKHDRRLQRMSTLRDSHELVLEQLKTYDSNISSVTSNEDCLRSKQSSHHHKSTRHSLKYEDSCLVWNELTKYKTLYQEIQQDKVKVDEELDSIKVKCASYKSFIAELRASLQKQKNASEDRLHEQEEAVFAAERNTEEQIEKLEMLNEELIIDRDKLSDNNRILNEELHELTIELNNLHSTVSKLTNEIESSASTQQVTASTMTDYITTADSTTQVERSSSDETMKKVWSSSTDKSVRRRRRYSDGQLAIDDKTEQTMAAQPSICSACGSTKGVSAIRQRSKTTRPLYSSSRSKSVQPSYNGRSKTVQNGRSKTIHSSSSRIMKESSKNKPHDKIQLVPFEHSQKCVWQEKMMKYQQKLKSFSQQVSMLTFTNSTLTHSLEESKEKERQQEEEMRQLTDRNNTLKSTIQSLRNEIKCLDSSCSELKGRCDGLESMGIKAITDSHTKDIHVQDENRRLKDEKKVLNDRLSILSNEVKNLQTKFKQSTTDNETLQLKVNNVERDLKQKRSLVNEYRRKMAAHDDQRLNDKEKINSLMNQVDSLQNSLEHFKQRVSELASINITCHKIQTEQFGKDKKNLKTDLTKCQKQLETVTKELSNVEDEYKKKSQQLLSVKEMANKRNEESHKEYQLALIDVEKETETAQLMIVEYRDLLMDLARAISLLQQRSMRKKVETTPQSKRKTDIMQKARTIAQTTFDLSDIEVDDFMIGGANRTMPVYTATGQLGTTLAGKVGVILNSHDSHLPKEQLLTEFTSCVQSLLL